MIVFVLLWVVFLPLCVSMSNYWCLPGMPLESAGFSCSRSAVWSSSNCELCATVAQVWIEARYLPSYRCLSFKIRQTFGRSLLYADLGVSLYCTAIGSLWLDPLLSQVSVWFRMEQLPARGSTQRFQERSWVPVQFPILGSPAPRLAVDCVLMPSLSNLFSERYLLKQLPLLKKKVISNP